MVVSGRHGGVGVGKTIWFHEEIHKRCVQLLKINTVEQLGDIFTKGLVQVPFEYLRKKIIG